MTAHTRRRFLKGATLGAAASTLLFTSRSRAAGANSRVRLGLIAFQDHGRGTVAHFKDIRLKSFDNARKNLRILGCHR